MAVSFSREWSILEPSFDMTLFQYFLRFAHICKKFAAFERTIVFVIVSKQFYYREREIPKIKSCQIVAIGPPKHLFQGV